VTLFRKVKFGLCDAFHIVFAMSNTAKRYSIVYTEGWLAGDSKKAKAVVAVESTNEGMQNYKRVYVLCRNRSCCSSTLTFAISKPASRAVSTGELYIAAISMGRRASKSSFMLGA